MSRPDVKHVFWAMARRRIEVASKLFPTVLMALDVCAAVTYAPTGDWRKVVYWLAAATLTCMVTW